MVRRRHRAASNARHQARSARLLLMGDVCLCEYMSHGHCGSSTPRTRTRRRGASCWNTLASWSHWAKPLSCRARIAGRGHSRRHRYCRCFCRRVRDPHDPTLELLARTAVAQAKAGMDIIAPSDMMDGRVAAIRAALDEAGYQNIPILSYAQSLPADSMARSAKLPIRAAFRRSSLLQMDRRICVKPCARSSST